MRAVHARLRGVTASVRVPFLVSGTQLSSPLPFYSTLLGLLGCCAGREVTPEEVRIGFSYRHNGETVDPVERLLRLGVDAKTRRLTSIKERGVGQRSFHADPILDLYVVGEQAEAWLLSPIGVPCLGRSQDVIWIEELAQIELKSRTSGILSGTWLPFSSDTPPGRIMRFAEYYRNDRARCIRNPGPHTLFVAMPSDPVERVAHSHLYHPSDSADLDAVIYLHKWAET